MRVVCVTCLREGDVVGRAERLSAEVRERDARHARRASNHLHRPPRAYGDRLRDGTPSSELLEALLQCLLVAAVGAGSVENLYACNGSGRRNQE